MGTIARNDITQKVIKTDPQNAQYAAGWDRIFAKKSAHEWLKETPEVIRIVSPDGWDEEVTMDTPIKWSDFRERLNRSTIIAEIK